jgi:hypothetical protein
MRYPTLSAGWKRWNMLADRFTRLTDILIQRVFRAIDLAEFLLPKITFVDRLNRAEKHGR